MTVVVQESVVLFTANEAAKSLRISTKTLSRLTAAGEIAATYIGTGVRRGVRSRPGELQRFADARSTRV